VNWKQLKKFLTSATINLSRGNKKKIIGCAKISRKNNANIRKEKRTWKE